MLLKWFYRYVFRKSTMTPEIQKRKNNALDEAYKKAESFSRENTLMIVNQLKVIRSLGSIEANRKELNLPNDKTALIDKLGVGLMLFNFGFLFAVLLAGTQVLPATGALFNRFGIYTPEAITWMVAINVLLMLVLFFVHSFAQTLIAKALLILIGIFIFPISLVTLSIAIIINKDTINLVRITLRRWFLEQKTNTPKSSRHMTAWFWSFVLIALVSLGALSLREHIVLADHHHVQISKHNQGEDSAINYQFGGFVMMKAQRDDSTIVKPGLYLQLREDDFDNPHELYFNYTINDHQILEEDLRFFISQPDHYNQKVILDESFDSLKDNVELNIELIKDGETLTTYMIDQTYVQHEEYIYIVRDLWQWEPVGQPTTID